MGLVLLVTVRNIDLINSFLCSQVQKCSATHYAGKHNYILDV